MKRLTERKGDGVSYTTGRYKITCYPKNDNLSDMDKIAVRLCELEDKLESGRAIEWLPVAIEDDVYIIENGEILITQLVAVTIYADLAILILADCKEITVWFGEEGYTGEVDHYEADFEFAFTSEEAEARLKELQGAGNE